MLADLRTGERVWIVIVGSAVAVTSGLFGGICGALAHAVSLVMYMFVEPQKIFECLGDLEPAYFVGAFAGVAAGIVWTCLFTGALLRSRRRTGKLPSVLVSFGNAIVHSMMAGMLFILVFLAWSLQRGTSFGFLTILVLIFALAIKWLMIGLIGGAVLRFTLRNPASAARENMEKSDSGKN